MGFELIGTTSRPAKYADPENIHNNPVEGFCFTLPSLKEFQLKFILCF